MNAVAKIRTVGSISFACAYSILTWVPVYADNSVATIEEAFLQERYDKVIQLSNDYLEHTPHSEQDVLFLRGAAQIERGNLEAAATDLRAYLRQDGLFAKEAKSLFEWLEEEMESEVAWSSNFLLQLGVIRDSRVIVPDPEVGSREVDDTAFRVRLAIDIEGDYGLATSYRAYWLSYHDAEDADRLEQSLEARLIRPVGNGDLESSLVVESRFRDYRENFWRYGLRGEYAWVTKPQHIAWISLEGGFDDFPEFDAADGAYVLGSTGYEQYLDRTSLFWDGYVQWHDADRQDQSFVEAGIGISVSHAMREELGTGFSVRGAFTAFYGSDPVLETKRDDTFVSTRMWVRWKLRDHVDLVPSFEYVKNNSNVDFAEYDEHILGLDLLWSSW